MQLKIATFNLFNYLEPPNAYYEFERIYSAEQWRKKQNWISHYLAEQQPDIIGFQEVFSPDSLQALVKSQGYPYFAVIDAPEVIDDFIYQSPVVAIASRYPIVEAVAVTPNTQLMESLAIKQDFTFSRKVLRATIDVPHLGHCDCYVVHFKSKRSMIEFDDKNSGLAPEKNIIESLKAQVAGSWGSTVQRGNEATLLMVEMIQRREQTSQPMILMGDFNNTLQDGVLSHLLTDNLRFASPFEQNAYLAKYCLNDAWDLFTSVLENEQQSNETENSEQPIAKKQTTEKSALTRAPTHYFNGKGSVLDYILLSSEFDASHHSSLYQVSNYTTYDQQLINPIFEHDGESTDHGIVMVELMLRS